MFLTEESALKAVQLSGVALQFVDEGCLTPAVCLAAVKQSGRAIERVPERLRTYEVCVAAVTQNGLALQYIHEQTPELCILAIQSNGNAIQFVKEQTPELCLRAVQKVGTALQFVKEQTHAICLAAVEQIGRAICHVTEKTYEICLAAYINCWYLTTEMKQHCSDFLTTEFRLAVIRAVPASCRDLADTPELCMAVVSANGNAIQYIPPEKQTLEICIAALKQDKSAMRYISSTALTFELLQAAIELPVVASPKKPTAGHPHPRPSAAELETTVLAKIADIERACSVASQRVLMVRGTADKQVTEMFKSRIEEATQLLQKARQEQTDLAASIRVRKQQIEKAREKLSAHEKKAEACATLKAANQRIQQFHQATARTKQVEMAAMRNRIQELEALMYHNEKSIGQKMTASDEPVTDNHDVTTTRPDDCT